MIDNSLVVYNITQKPDRRTDLDNFDYLLLQPTLDTEKVFFPAIFAQKQNL